MQKWFVLLLIAALFALVGGCTDETASEYPPVPVSTPTVKQTTIPQTRMVTPAPVPVTTLSVSTSTVTIMDNAFMPAELTVKAGSQVRWVNGDDHPHRIQFVSKDFSPFLVGSSQSFSQQFSRQGIFDYSCLIYPDMHGTVTVVE